MKILLATILLCIAAVALGQSKLFPDPSSTPAGTPAAPAVEGPHSPAAIEAKRKYDLTVKLAKEAYQKAVVAADKDYIDALAAAEDTAMKGGLSDKPEADRLDAARLAAVDKMKEDEKSDALEENAAHAIAIAGTSWEWEGHKENTLTFKTDGSYTDTGKPKPGSWKAMDANTIRVVAPVSGEVYRVTFSTDGKYIFMMSETYGGFSYANRK